MKNCMVLTTVPNDKQAKLIIQNLFDSRLAACIQSMPIESHYVWEGELCCSKEILLIIKTNQSCYPDIEGKITDLHEYDVPQIVQVPFSDGLSPYLEWIKASVDV
ncbi:divalent-cation tolerance protein CutA [Vibrio sp. ZSDE26]|uniref:Divalent-cation tolerance protein CutA n=1 Tax=Vibrio amylolyticus TaxID=2847292 RepID=A0A9X2BJX9_9VIBR|nr:divalent-cation tolerance protein CutA [Vibrio amylolyticus]MCK6263887.1 divalent-cation tolerance protein CutA [Vibrio amylolyticus]